MSPTNLISKRPDDTCLLSYTMCCGLACLIGKGAVAEAKSVLLILKQIKGLFIIPSYDSHTSPKWPLYTA